MPSKHKVTQGEGIAKIAQKYGFRSWETIWNDAENESLKSVRSNPNILQPGDIVVIPDPVTRYESAATEQLHRFVYKVPTMRQTIRLKILDIDSSPMANLSFVLTVDEEKLTGLTDASGMLEQDVPVGASEGKLEIDGNDWVLEFESLNPIGEEAPDNNILGAQSRLNNLGIPCPETGELDEATQEALRCFQRRRELGESGKLDDHTKSALKDEHGC